MIPSAILMTCLLGVARAQDDAAPTHHAPPPDGVEPEAEAPPALHAPVPRVEDPAADSEPALDPDPLLSAEARRERMKAYGAGRLELRSWSAPRHGTASVAVGWSWGWWPWHPWAWGPTMGIRYRPVPGGDWAVFQDQQQLTVPGYLEIVGDDLRLASLQTDLKRTGRSRGVGVGVTIAGVGATAAGFIGMNGASSYDEYYAWSTLGVSGIITALVGLSVHGNASARAHNLEHSFPYTVTYDETRSQVHTHNQALRDELGLPGEPAEPLPDKRPPRRR